MANVASFLLLPEVKPMSSRNAKSQPSYHRERKRMVAGPLPNG